MSLEAIKGFREQVALGFIREVGLGDLVLFNYTDKCTYEKAWNEFTRQARGIIYNQVTGELVAKPFEKFFNLGEMPETSLSSLPDEEYEVFEKVDGSLGIIYCYDGDWQVATRGSFSSDQAQKGLVMVCDKYKFYETAAMNTTYLVEIIYPENKIVVNYGQVEQLVLLGAIREGKELTYEELVTEAAYLQIPICKRYSYTINEMIKLQETMPKDQEGFVVRFKSGLRVKIKGNEYMKVHKMISNMSPISFWESMEKGVVNRDYLAQLPEEFKADFEPMVLQLEEHYKQVLCEIAIDFLKLPATGTDKEALKKIGLFVQSNNHGLKHPGAMFPWNLRKLDAVEKYVMKYIRPTGNVIKEVA